MLYALDPGFVDRLSGLAQRAGVGLIGGDLSVASAENGTLRLDAPPLRSTMAPAPTTVAPGRLCDGDGLARRAAGRDDVFDDDHAIVRR